MSRILYGSWVQENDMILDPRSGYFLRFIIVLSWVYHVYILGASGYNLEYTNQPTPLYRMFESIKTTIGIFSETKQIAYFGFEMPILHI